MTHTVELRAGVWCAVVTMEDGSRWSRAYPIEVSTQRPRTPVQALAKTKEQAEMCLHWWNEAAIRSEWTREP